MDIECKSGRHFSNIDDLKQCSKDFTRCSVCITIDPPSKPPVILFCPFCLKKSLYAYKNQDYYECMNDGCPNHHVKVAYRSELIMKMAVAIKQTETE
jgi:hypothetical protein